MPTKKHVVAPTYNRIATHIAHNPGLFSPTGSPPPYSTTSPLASLSPVRQLGTTSVFAAGATTAYFPESLRAHMDEETLRKAEAMDEEWRALEERKQQLLRDWQAERGQLLQSQQISPTVKEDETQQISPTVKKKDETVVAGSVAGSRSVAQGEPAPWQRLHHQIDNNNHVMRLQHELELARQERVAIEKQLQTSYALLPEASHEATPGTKLTDSELEGDRSGEIDSEGGAALFKQYASDAHAGGRAVHVHHEKQPAEEGTVDAAAETEDLPLT